MQFYEINIYKFMIFTLYTVYNKHKMLKTGNETRKKIARIIANARIILLTTVSSKLTHVKE